ncbi:hypothetical protein CPB83DRAFT_234812 [Crepidotus variabilis]|uniref:Uncharacterized protein n=1 Tax=Crepidotus variabilis TaxID=179855 RepID=A0A9P6ETL8_9AGAR|nr:hypothetical protein CPB83DRAFT_234812 [Crepidotus variabilis]
MRAVVTLPDDPTLNAALKKYHLKGINDSTEISKLLLKEHGITLCETSVTRRRKKLGYRAGGYTTKTMEEDAKKKLILDQMAKDPKGRLGARMIKEGIFKDTGIHLTRDYIREAMRQLDPEAYSKRGPRHMKAQRRERLLREARLPGASEERHGAQQPVPSTSRELPVHLPIPPQIMELDNESDFDHDPLPELLSAAGPSSAPSLDIRVWTHPTETHTAFTSEMVGLLQDALPKMTALSRFLDNTETGLAAVDIHSHQLLLRGMETAALLERQLARVISRLDKS